MLFGCKKRKSHLTIGALTKPSLEDSKGLFRSQVNIQGISNVIRSRVAVVIDYSVSMSSALNFGVVQELLNRIFSLALKIDDNLELEVFLFNKQCIRLETSMIMGNYQNFISKEIVQKGLGPSKGTAYASFIDETMAYYNNGSTDPAFIIVITDCDNRDYAEARKAIRESSECPIFYEFIDINDKFKPENFLKFSNIDNEKINNTAFVRYQDIVDLSDDELYSKLLESYPLWLKGMNFI